MAQNTKSALRFNQGKAQLSYVLSFPQALAGIARVCEYGAKKYTRWNYLLSGKDNSEYVDCLLRHLEQWFNGEDRDESGCHHLDHVAWNALALSEFVQNGTALDFRPHKVLDADEAKTDLTTEHPTTLALVNRARVSGGRRPVGRKRAKQGRRS